MHLRWVGENFVRRRSTWVLSSTTACDARRLCPSKIRHVTVWSDS